MIVSLPIGDKGVGLFVHDVMGNFPILKVLAAFPKNAVSFVFNSNCCYNEEITLEDFTLSNLRPQSGEEGRPVGADTTNNQINMNFEDQEDESTTMVPVVNSLYKPTTSQNSDISQFLSRPVLIITKNVALGTTVDETYKPWQLFFEHTSIKKKIDNYAFIRCDLHLKVVVNASPFYYGAILVAYNPLRFEFNSGNGGAGGVEIVPYSQRPNVIVYPQNCEGGELICPFIYHREWLPLTSSTALQNMGALNMDSIVNLTSANGTTGTSIDVQIYAWADNVQLAGLTVSLAAQSGTEYGKGALSKPASAIARSTGLLGKLPVIGPFMTATSIAAGAVSNIASLFGYTKVPVLDDVKPYKNLPFHGLAVDDISDCTERICIDSKNELSINNTCIGDKDTDPLIISDFVQRKSYLTQFNWSNSDAAGALLWNSYVTPYMSVITAGTGQATIDGTPPWLVANMFNYWRGDIIFDIKIVCTQYHKGRLRVSWDPVGDIANTTDSSTEVYTSIIDISENTTVSLRVPYCQRTAYHNIPTDPTDPIFSVTSLPADSNDFYNGILTFRVLNELSSPLATGTIQALVFVRGAENLEFAYPRDIPNELYYFTAQSGIEDMQQIDFGGKSTVDDHINLVYMGEKITSLRSLMMRCNYHRTDINASSTSLDFYEDATICRRPLFKGYDPNGIHTANEIVGASTAPYNFVLNTPYHMISQCFLGERGSFTWKYNLNSENKRSVMVAKSGDTLLASNYTFTTNNFASGTGDVTKAFLIANESTNPGMALINQNTNTGLSVNFPQYNNHSFMDTNPSSRVQGLTDISTNDSVRLSYLNLRTPDAIRNEYLFHYFQVGPDYSPVFFLNVPKMYVYDSTPTGA